MMPNHLISAYGRGVICALVLAFPAPSTGQDPASGSVNQPSWNADLPDESRFPVERLDLPTKIKWFGLRIVAPRKLDNIVGFFAYPAAQVCREAPRLSQDSILVVDQQGGTQAWNLRELSWSGQSSTTSPPIEVPAPPPVPLHGPLTYFCNEYSDQYWVDDAYLGFGQKFDGPIARDFTDPEIFWTTTNAVGLDTAVWGTEP